MNRPDNIHVYDELDLKLGIKSSLPHIKSTLGLAILLWECCDKPSEIFYSMQDNEEIVISTDTKEKIISFLARICEEEQIEQNALINKINKNQLFKSQLEALIVAFELVWRLAKVSFVEDDKPASSERTGKIRYPKKLLYTTNIDVIHSLIENDIKGYIKVLLAWIGFDINFNEEYDFRMKKILTTLSESAVFKMSDGENDIIFNQNSLYSKLIETNQTVDIKGDKEAKGSLRILKSLLSDSMNPYLQYENGNVNNNSSELEKYQKRVETFLRLSATKVIGVDDIDAENKGLALEKFEEKKLSTGTNILIYGVPGSGKSWTIEHEYCKKDSKVERLVFHPDYTYSDFIGQILPNVADDGQVSYRFTPGPFTNILKDAYIHPETEYILIIEEINRGNAPAIFGEVFQLLDRKSEVIEGDDGFPVGTSEYGITNENIAKVVYGDARHKIRIPSNLSIIGTMNTSDQNVFTLDTAFQRRWEMRLIENNFEHVDRKLADAPILDTGITWKTFCSEINKIIVGNNARMTSTEDKRLGAYFVHFQDLIFDDKMGKLSEGEYDELRKKEENNFANKYEVNRLAEIRKAMKQNRKFPEKVIKYLWDDAFKFNREIVFDTVEYQSLEQVIRKFMYSEGIERLAMFKDNVRNAFIHPED
jgi:ATPase family associated with various cellular activities (AAA)